MANYRCILFVFIYLVLCLHGRLSKSITNNDLLQYRNRVVQMFQHAYNGYLKYAYPLDELRPLTCDGHDTWGSYSLTLIDALDTLAIMGNYSEFQRVSKLLEETLDFDRDINVSVFETNIRVVGGLLSGHLLSKQAGVPIDVGWPCSGPLLRLAEQVARKLLPAFNTSTGMPYGTVNLLYGVPKGETSITCTAGVGTFIVEFGALSQLTGLPIFIDTAIQALHGLWRIRSPIGMVGNHVDVLSGKWTALDSGIGAGVDSYFEYLVKGAILFQYPELMEMFQEYKQVLTKHVKREDWYMWAHMDKGTITLPIFQSLESFWPGLLSLTGDIDSAMKTLHNYHQVWRQYGFVPEFYNIPKAEAQANREGYPLRPELIESTMYLYQATKDPYLLEVAIDILESIEHSTRTPCGYATVKNVKDHQLDNRMESFFLAETTKYLYLIFDPDNFIHNTGDHGSMIKTSSRGECIVNAGGYVFNTEAHPIDAAALFCCSAEKSHQMEEVEKIVSHIDLMSLMGVWEDKTAEEVLRRMATIEDTWNKKVNEHQEGERREEDFEDEKEKEDRPKTQKLNEKSDKTSLNMEEIKDIVEPSINSDDQSSSPSKPIYEISCEPPLPSSTSSTVEQLSSSLKLFPPEGNNQQQKAPAEENLSAEASLEHVTIVPLDLWTLQRSSNNRTDQECVNRLFTCPSRPFHSRWSLMGEMFVDK